MAVVNPTITYLTPSSISITWSGLNTGDEGAPVEVAPFEKQFAQMSPSFSNSVKLYFSNDNANYDSPGPFLITTPTEIIARGRYVKPAWTGGGVGPSDVNLYCYNEA